MTKSTLDLRDQFYKVLERPDSQDRDIGEAERRIIRTGRGYPLFMLVSRLQSPVHQRQPLTPEQIGLVYANSVLALPSRNHYLSVLNTNNPEVIKDFKKRFQEATRLSLYLLIQDLELGGKPFGSIQEKYQAQLEKSLVSIAKPSQGIEHEIYLMVSEKSPLEKIADSLVKSSGKYYKEYRETGMDSRFKEYDRVLSGLKQRL